MIAKTLRRVEGPCRLKHLLLQVLDIPDCSYLGEEDLSKAVQRIKGPGLERVSMRSVF